MDVRENLGMKFELIKAKVGGKKKTNHTSFLCFLGYNRDSYFHFH